jgi:hypothetical protein
MGPTHFQLRFGFGCRTDIYARFAVVGFWAPYYKCLGWPSSLTILVPDYCLHIFIFFAGVNTALTPIMQTGPFVRRLLLIATTAGLVSLILKIALVPIWQSAGVAIGGAVAYGLFLQFQ